MNAQQQEYGNRNAVSDRGIRVLKELPKMESVTVWRSAVTDRGILSLNECQRLKRLELYETGLADAGLAALARLPDLELLEIEFRNRSSVFCSPRTVVEFMDRKPDCTLNVSRGRTIKNATIRHIAKNGEPWPKYEYPGK